MGGDKNGWSHGQPVSWVLINSFNAFPNSSESITLLFFATINYFPRAKYLIWLNIKSLGQFRHWHFIRSKENFLYENISNWRRPRSCVYGQTICSPAVNVYKQVFIHFGLLFYCYPKRPLIIVILIMTYYNWFYRESDPNLTQSEENNPIRVRGKVIRLRLYDPSLS